MCLIAMESLKWLCQIMGHSIHQGNLLNLLISMVSWGLRVQTAWLLMSYSPVIVLRPLKRSGYMATYLSASTRLILAMRFSDSIPGRPRSDL